MFLRRRLWPVGHVLFKTNFAHVLSFYQNFVEPVFRAPPGVAHYYLQGCQQYSVLVKIASQTVWHQSLPVATIVSVQTQRPNSSKGISTRLYWFFLRIPYQHCNIVHLIINNRPVAKSSWICFIIVLVFAKLSSALIGAQFFGQAKKLAVKSIWHGHLSGGQVEIFPYFYPCRCVIMHNISAHLCILLTVYILKLNFR